MFLMKGVEQILSWIAYPLRHCAVPCPRHSMGFAAIANNSILVFGGSNGGMNYVAMTGHAHARTHTRSVTHTNLHPMRLVVLFGLCCASADLRERKNRRTFPLNWQTEQSFGFGSLILRLVQEPL